MLRPIDFLLLLYDSQLIIIVNNPKMRTFLKLTLRVVQPKLELRIPEHE